MANDSQTIVIAQRHRTEPIYDYCNRSVGRLAGMGRGMNWVFHLRLAGRYAAYQPRYTGLIFLWDTRSGQHSELTPGGSPPFQPFLLSSSGVVAAIVIIQPAGIPTEVGGPTAFLDVLTLHREENLDAAYLWATQPVVTYPLPLAHLQLYDCAAGCAPNTTTVAWTHSGEQRYAQVTP